MCLFISHILTSLIVSGKVLIFDTVLPNESQQETDQKQIETTDKRDRNK